MREPKHTALATVELAALVTQAPPRLGDRGGFDLIAVRALVSGSDGCGGPEPRRKVSRMSPNEMQRLFERHRQAEAARDFDAILSTFVENCFLETHPLGLRSEGRAAARSAYEAYFTAFPDLAPDDEGVAFGKDVMVVWGTLRGTSGGDWVGVPPSGRSFAVPFANVTPFRDGLMEGESIYFDLATLCDQAALPLDEVRAGAQARAEELSSATGG
jgi:steroid delta-isomerase-like uncharacterized protein